MSRARLAYAVLAFAALLSLPACTCTPTPTPDGGEDAGDADAGQGDGGAEADAGTDGGTIAEGVYCPTLAQARCDRELDCALLDLDQLPTCLARLTAACRDDFRRVDAGGVTFDPAAAAACVAAVGALRCIQGPLALPDACAFPRVFDPAGPPGTACVDSADCAQGFCFGTASECRSCRAFAGLSQPCSTPDRRCDPALQFCPPASIPRTCAALLADGQPCGSSSECATGWCNWQSQVPDAGVDRCGRLSLGAGCGDPGDCAPGAYCAGYAWDGVTVTPGACAPRLALGAPCTNHPDDDGCVEPATCLGGACTLAPPFSLDAGAECESLFHCQEPFFCRDFEAPQPDGGRSLRAGTCTQRLAPSAPCRFTTYVDTDCAPLATCGASSTCVLRGSADAGCQADYECRDFLACPASSARCSPLRALGQPCDPAGAPCAGGFCAEAAPDAGATCLAPLSAGAACDPTAPSTCASGRCLAPADGGSSGTCLAACIP